MAPSLVTRKSSLVIPLILAGVAISLAALAIAYLRQPPHRAEPPRASAEAKAYLPNLALSDVSMIASENFMKQQVVEVKGKISNKGPRALESIDVYCLFAGVDGREIHRERLRIVNAKSSPLRPNETRDFRLPFDAVPDGWNQALPAMVIAQITFANP